MNTNIFFSVQNFANPSCEGGCGGGDPREEEDRRFKYRLVLDRMRELKDKDEGGRERTHDKDCEEEKIYLEPDILVMNTTSVPRTLTDWHRLKDSVKEMEGLFHPMDEAYLQVLS